MNRGSKRKINGHDHSDEQGSNNSKPLKAQALNFAVVKTARPTRGSTKKFPETHPRLASSLLPQSPIVKADNPTVQPRPALGERQTGNIGLTKTESLVLFHYDLNPDYGPCIGIRRSQRLERAGRNGFNNQELQLVKRLLDAHASAHQSPIEASIWSNIV